MAELSSDFVIFIRSWKKHHTALSCSFSKMFHSSLISGILLFYDIVDSLSGNRRGPATEGVVHFSCLTCLNQHGSPFKTLRRFAKGLFWMRLTRFRYDCEWILSSLLNVEHECRTHDNGVANLAVVGGEKVQLQQFKCSRAIIKSIRPSTQTL